MASWQLLILIVFFLSSHSSYVVCSFKCQSCNHLYIFNFIPMSSLIEVKYKYVVAGLGPKILSFFKAGTPFIYVWTVTSTLWVLL